MGFARAYRHGPRGGDGSQGERCISVSGASLRIGAAKGTIFYPAGGLQQMESGAFDGGVTVELVPSGQTDPQAVPTARLFTPSLTFSAVTGEVATQERFRTSRERVRDGGQAVADRREPER